MPPARRGFSADFWLFFLRGLKALLPTLITLSVLFWAWNFLWDSLGRHLIYLVKYVWYLLVNYRLVDEQQTGYIARYWSDDFFRTRLLGVLLAVLLVYFVGLLLGNLIGRTFWKLGEAIVMKVPVVRAIYPAVKQITDFVLQEKSSQFSQSRVVACRPHANEIYSVGLVTGNGMAALEAVGGEGMVTVFIPSSPTAFSGYVMIVPRSQVVELPITVEEAMRLLVSGGVLEPKSQLLARATAAEVAGPDAAGLQSPAPDAPGPNAPGPDAAVTKAAGPNVAGPDAAVTDVLGPDVPGPEDPGPDVLGPNGAGPETSAPRGAVAGTPQNLRTTETVKT